MNLAVSTIMMIAFSSLYCPDSFSQTTSITHGLGIEVGLGHNQLFWKATDVSADRTRLSFKPSVRLSYQKSVARLRWIPFVGFDVFGGRSGTDSSGYKDRIWLYAIDFGNILQYPVRSFTAGFGFKVNRHVKTVNEHFGSVIDPPNTRRTWQKSSMDFFFKDWSANLGVRLDHSFSGHFVIAAEGWLGLTHLQKGSLDFLSIRENHYRFLVGYRL